MKERNKKKVIMGGSFNPPTLAHYMLMDYAIDALNAEFGYFVPVSDAYLKTEDAAFASSYRLIFGNTC